MGRIERFQAQVLRELRYCFNCQPWEDGDPVWIFGARIEMDELLRSLGVPYNLHAEVVKGVDCPNCGSSVDPGAIWAYATSTRSNTRNGCGRRRAPSYGARLFDFSRHIQDYPYLGSAHPVGRKILREMPRFPRAPVTESLGFEHDAPRTRGATPYARFAAAQPQRSLDTRWAL